jgi:cell division protease FtsH
LATYFDRQIAKRRSKSDPEPGAAKGSRQTTMTPPKAWVWFNVILLANYLSIRLFVAGPERPVRVPYNLFKEEVGKNNVQAIFSRGDTIMGRFKAKVAHWRGSGGSRPR